MTVALPKQSSLIQTNDIVVGYGIVPAYRASKKPITWVMPGFNLTQDKTIATECARRIDKLIQSNMSKKNQKQL